MQRIRIVALLVLISLMTYFHRTAMSIGGPAIARQFGLSETQLGAIFSAFFLGYAGLMIPGGRLVDRLGPRWTLGLVGMATAAFMMLTAAARTFSALFAVRLLLGISTAPLYPSAARMNANWMELRFRGQVQGWIAAGAGLGGALSPVLFSHLITRTGWPMAFVITGVVTAVIAGIWLAGVRDFPGERSRPAIARARPTPWRTLLTNRHLMLLTAGYFAVDYFEYIFFYWTYYYLGEVRHMDTARSAWYTTALFLSWMVFAPIGGRVTDAFVRRLGLKAGMRIVPMVAMGISAALLFVATGLESVEATGVLLAVALGFAAATDAGYWAAAIHIGGSEAGAASGILNTGGNLGGFLAPVITPWIASAFGWSAGLYFGCLLVSLSILVWLFLDPTPRNITPVS